jgi:NADH-quinone oxidoreductase subunit E
MAHLPDEIRQQILAYLPRYPSKQAVTLPALHIVHDAMRCVSNEAIREIADMLDLSPAQVHDTMSFYQFFREADAPLGKTRLWVCRSLACGLRGGEELLAHLCKSLNVQPGSTTMDGKIALEFAECLGACELAPSMLANDVREGPLRTDVVDDIIGWLHQLRGKERASAELLNRIRAKGRVVSFSVEGSDERRNLQKCRANALNLVGLIILQEDVRKIEALEEFLHGTQERLGLFQHVNTVEAEIHVKQFMLRHRHLLGISQEDADILEVMLKGYLHARNV